MKICGTHMNDPAIQNICSHFSKIMGNRLEAMSRGLAVAITDLETVSCLVSDKTGWLVELGIYSI